MELNTKNQLTTALVTIYDDQIKLEVTPKIARAIQLWQKKAKRGQGESTLGVREAIEHLPADEQKLILDHLRGWMN